MFVIHRYLVVLYYQANKAFEKLNTQKKEEDLKKMKEKYDLKTPGRN
jgi:pre-mRNA branch site protein p14